jgi:hypothetical protein
VSALRSSRGGLVLDSETALDRRPEGPVVLITTVGVAAGARAAAAALACAASEPDRAALLVDLDDGRPPRPSLIATAGARKLEERLTAHMPEAAVASRGRLCQLTLPEVAESLDQIAAALPLARESAAILHLPPALLRPALEEPRIPATAVLLRADLGKDRALTALVVRDLIERGLRAAVLKRQPSWLAGRAALLGMVSSNSPANPDTLVDRLLAEDKKLRKCYDQEDGAEDEQRQDARLRRARRVR